MTDEFRRDVNRFGKLPAINHNGFKLAESVAIFHYLGRKGIIPERFYPRNDIEKLTRIDEYLQWHQNGLFFSGGMLFFVQKPDATEKPPAEVISTLTKQLISNLDDLENKWLADTKYLAGNDEISYADLASAVIVEQITGTRVYKLDENKYAKIAKWMAEVKAYFGKDFVDAHQLVYKYGERWGSTMAGSA